MGKTASIFIDGEVNSYSYTASIQGVRDTLNWSGQFDDITVTINSCGGDIAEGLGIYDLLRSYEKPITTVVIGQCCSAATIIFLAGSTRLIYENVVAFMVHQAAGEPNGPATADQLRTIADFVDSYNERMTAIYIEHTGASAETVAEWLSKDSFMTAQEALDNGFATAIAKPVQAKYYASRRYTPPSPSTNQPQIDPKMKIITNQAKRLATVVMALLAGAKVVAKEVTTSTGEKLTIDMADDTLAEEQTVTKDGEPAPDGKYTIDGVEITVKGGKIEKIDTGGTSTDVNAEDETTVTAEDDTTVTAENEEESEEEPDLAQQLADEKAKTTALEAKVTALERNQATVTAQMKLLLGTKESGEPKVPAPKGVKKKVTAVAVPDEDEQERQDMLDERAAKGLGMTLEEYRASQEA
ncbi:Clp protease ClpP [Spirosoma arboris]|uniref:Clp protease ClpP n=1 Tax=Spirosoma arboris TaxID=2682092 RepID=UPI0012FA1099|nr:Clp protease ClpP [Spirosoma arboris]